MRIQLEATDYAHLYREKTSGIYYARIDLNRKTVRKSLRTAVLTEAIARLAAFLEQSGKETPSVGNMSWYLAVDTYIARQELRVNLKPRALESAKLFAEHARRLVENDMQAGSITPSMCRKWWAEKAQSCSPRTANGTLGAVRNVFAMLVEMGVVATDPTSKIERLTLRQASFNIPSKDDFRAIIEEMKRAPILRGYNEKKLYSPAADMVGFLAYSGLRIEEARRLTWKDIGKESISVPDIKHATSRRTLYINPSLGEIIESIRAHSPGATKDTPVFHIENPRKALTNACKRLGLPHVRVHDLRHFFATSCIEAGIDIPTVAKWLGHKDGGALAMRVYGHLRDAHSKEQAAKLKF